MEAETEPGKWRHEAGDLKDQENNPDLLNPGLVLVSIDYVCIYSFPLHVL